MVGELDIVLLMKKIAKIQEINSKLVALNKLFDPLNPDAEVPDRIEGFILGVMGALDWAMGINDEITDLIDEMLDSAQQSLNDRLGVQSTGDSKES